MVDDAEDLANTLSHDDLLEITKSSLCTLIATDPLLSDLPSDIIYEEILSQIAVEHGKSITVYVFREADEDVLKVIVPQNINVLGLKKAIARHFEIYQQRIQSKVKISWKYIWKTYDLNFGGVILDNNYSCIDEYGVVNKVTLSFKKKRKKRK